MRQAFIWVGVFAGVLLLLFVLELFGLGMFKFFAPKREGIRREVFEETKSYNHGVAQDLGKYFQEYQEAGTEREKEVIRSVVRMRFAEYDAENLQNDELKRFLKNMRGY